MEQKSYQKILRILPYAILVMFAVFVLLCCRMIVTDGSSMEPSYMAGDRVICVRTFSEPDVGDAILLKKDGVLMVKRVVAVAGDDASPYSYWGNTIVPDGYIFVAGDNADKSYDSRNEKFGLIPVGDVWGKVWFSF